MSDGPHRSLNMPPGWKRLAECADKRAFAPEDVRIALSGALEQDWRAQIPSGLLRTVKSILGDHQTSLFSDQQVAKLEGLRGSTAAHPLGNTFLEYAIQVSECGGRDNEAVREVIARTLSDRAARGARQVEEHCCRESTQHRAAHVRERLESVVVPADIRAIAGRLADIDKTAGYERPVRQTGLDDGVQL